MVKATAGEAFTIELPSSPTTGYRWEPSELADDVELLDEQFDVPADAQPGDSAVQRFRLVARRAGHLTLTFALKRSWEQQGVEQRHIEVDFE
jgi:predicted secreted protein